eukprot:TRINITY_DN24706_c0_g1_i1.p2 TRINITY_DN24706_c0_g1~~TRINITY_DN24706_c0_g1_i1.p2  ORF type:complete len:113 (+),score=30.20 TRINITY_DN24706_c0_g1_i1:162-500(+)
MFGLGDSSEKHAQQFENSTPEELKQHKPNKLHELIAGAAGWAAMQAYEKHQKANGKPPSHAAVKELIAGFAASQVDKILETKGLNWIDKEQAKHAAVEHANKLADEKYGQGN